MDYRATLNLPQTSFKMKANLSQKEPMVLKQWDKEDLYQQIQERNTDKPLFVLHDGPPYANGNIHLGTAFNKILKDIILRSKRMAGFNAPYIPGWDCHGLPIEWQIEQRYRQAGKDKDAVEGSGDAETRTLELSNFDRIDVGARRIDDMNRVDPVLPVGLRLVEGLLVLDVE